MTGWPAGSAEIQAGRRRKCEVSFFPFPAQLLTEYVGKDRPSESLPRSSPA